MSLQISVIGMPSTWPGLKEVMGIDTLLQNAQYKKQLNTKLCSILFGHELEVGNNMKRCRRMIAKGNLVVIQDLLQK